ncbi:hypothetical protein O3Q51_07095 [Cryomorphaceae bacterium 1068]|nr:hypothetical protein [Cryomorphaceae bacterium 1068]
MATDEAILHFEKKLTPKVPKGTAGVIANWIVELNVIFVISKPRQTKLGDFRPGHNGKAPRISVNGDLHPYSFLITTIHEFAHLGCYLKHGREAAPHGKEWKGIYTNMLKLFVDQGVFPSDLTKSLQLHISRPKASSCSCPILSRALAEYDAEEGEFLGTLAPNDQFEFRGERYQYTLLRRTRVLCRRMADGKQYLISSRAKVNPLVTIS